MCAIDSRSFETIAGPGFMDFVDQVLEIQSRKPKRLRAADILSTPHCVSVHATSLANVIRKTQSVSIRTRMEESGGCITTDFCSEHFTKTSFASMTFHCIENSKLCTELICCSEYDPFELKSSEKIREFTLAKLQPLGIDPSLSIYIYR